MSVEIVLMHDKAYAVKEHDIDEYRNEDGTIPLKHSLSTRIASHGTPIVACQEQQGKGQGVTVTVTSA